MQKIEILRTEELGYRANEEYKTLRTNLMFSGENVKVVAITSCTPSEGKTTVALNLSMSLAQADKRVLYIDADMRRSVVVGRYKMAHATYGLSHYLSGQKKLEEVLSQTNIDGLNLIVAGVVPPNPSELLGGEHFSGLVEAARSAYDYIIIDTPPVGSVVDGVIVAKQCDGVALVLEYGTIRYKFAQKVKEQIEMAGCKILGVVLNKVDSGNGSRYGGYYRRYYGHNYDAYTDGYYGAQKKKDNN